MAEGRALILGLGNLSRQDDGLGWFAVNRVRYHLGLEPIGEFDDGMSELGREVDSAFLPQISSDLADLVAEYDRLVLVDARIGGEMQVYWSEVVAPARDHARLLTHDMLPAELLSLARMLYGKAPQAFVVSVPGLTFDFGSGLSAPVAALLDEAAALCLQLALGSHCP